MRRTIMHYGPTVSRGGPRISRQTVSRNTVRNSQGIIHRAGPGAQWSETSKSRMSVKDVRGIRQPGYFTPNYSGPTY